MKEFLDYLCGKDSDYTIIRCQKVTRKELESKLNMNTFLVYASYDEHQGIYGIFSSIQEFCESMKKEEDYIQAQLYYGFQIDEIEKTNVIDTIKVCDIFNYDELSSGAQQILEESNA